MDDVAAEHQSHGQKSTALLSPSQWCYVRLFNQQNKEAYEKTNGLVRYRKILHLNWCAVNHAIVVAASCRFFAALRGERSRALLPSLCAVSINE